MELKYQDEIIEDCLVKEFYNDTNDMWTQRETPDVRDVIKWCLIKGYITNREK